MEVPQQTNMVPPPLSPPEAGAGMGDGAPALDPAAGQYVGPEHLQKLDDLIQGIQGKMSQYNSSRLVGKNEMNAKKDAAIQDALQALRKAGVDISDPAAVSAFLDQLRNLNPDLAEILEEQLDKLFVESPAEADGLGEANPMENYENLSQEVRGPLQN